MKIRKFNIIVACLALLLPLSANAGLIALNTWYAFGFGGPGSSLVGGSGFLPGTNPPDGNPVAEADRPAWTISLSGPATLTVLDLFSATDRFEIFNNLASIGTTSLPGGGGNCGSDISCALASSEYSRGVFNLGPGSYSFTGNQILGTAGAGVFIVASTPVPAPTPLALFAAALAAAVAFRRRKSRAQGA